MPLNGRRRVTKEEKNELEMISLLREMYSRPEREVLSDSENKGRDMSYITELGFARPPEPSDVPPK
jgi:hypothetical protein